MQQRVEPVARKPREAIQHALDPPKGVLAQREVMFRQHLETDFGEQALQRRGRELEEVTREVEVKPRGTGPARLCALEIRDRNHQPTARFESPMQSRERPTWIRQMLEDMPDDHLVEAAVLIARLRDTRCDSDFRPRVGAASRFGADLLAVDLETAVGQFAEQNTTAAADIEDPRPRLEIP
jgi:hypothetical protein